jgi:copper chaperone NosL
VTGIRRTAAAAPLLLALACAGGPPPPAALETNAEACAWCRMSVSDPRLAAQLVAPSEEPMFFDDIGCLANMLEGVRRDGKRSPGMAYLADHRTGAWVPAHRAILTRNRSFATPMGSHLLAHADTASRDADPAAAGGVSVALAEVFGPSGPPDGLPHGENR